MSREWVLIGLAAIVLLIPLAWWLPIRGRERKAREMHAQNLAGLPKVKKVVDDPGASSGHAEMKTTAEARRRHEVDRVTRGLGSFPPSLLEDPAPDMDDQRVLIDRELREKTEAYRRAGPFVDEEAPVTLAVYDKRDDISPDPFPGEEEFARRDGGTDLVMERAHLLDEVRRAGEWIEELEGRLEVAHAKLRVAYVDPMLEGLQAIPGQQATAEELAEWGGTDPLSADFSDRVTRAIGHGLLRSFVNRGGVRVYQLENREERRPLAEVAAPLDLSGDEGESIAAFLHSLEDLEAGQ